MKHKIWYVLFLLYTTSFYNAYGHGLGFDTIQGIQVDNKKITITVEMPSYFDSSQVNKIIISAIDENTKQNAKNVTFLIGLFHEQKMIFRNYFFAPNGVLNLNVNSTNENEIKIIGKQDSLLGAWHATESQPLELRGPLFESGGLYQFEIEIRTIDEPTNIIENQRVYTAALSIIEETEYYQKDLKGNDVKFKVKSYFDRLSNFEYDPNKKQVRFEMPFDWNENSISHIPVVHVEVHFPKNFTEFLYPSYVGHINGIDLFKSSITIDDYTKDDERIVHFVLLTDHLKSIKNQLNQQRITDLDKISFRLTASESINFPLTALTRDEQFQVDLSWDPLEIEPDTPIKFVFTIRDGATGEPLRNSSYDFVVLQEGKEIYRNRSVAIVGGSFETVTFTESQTGPTIIRFENIRDSGQSTEFGMVVVPEFSLFVMMIMILSLGVATLFSRQKTLFFK